MLKKTYRISSCVFAASCITAGFSPVVQAHGYVSEPPSRAYLCDPNKSQSNSGLNCGGIAGDPQSLEAGNGFPDGNTPEDGQLASAGLPKGAGLDQVRSDWHKTTVGRDIDFKWHITAVHNTSNWRFFITKQGWNPNKPLSRADFDSRPFCEHKQPGQGTSPDQGDNMFSCTGNQGIPADRSGYHVIYAIWDMGPIQNTNTSFYQVIDVNVENSRVNRSAVAPLSQSHRLVQEVKK